MKRRRWQIEFGFSLVLLAAALFGLHFTIFRDAEHIFIYGLGDIAFLPLEVLVVTLIVHGLLDSREKRAKLDKLNMVIGAFFSEIGHELLGLLSDSDPRAPEVQKVLAEADSWSDKKFGAVRADLNKHAFEVAIDRVPLGGLRDFLAAKSDFMLRLLENPNLLEHESFTELLFAVWHLSEELSARTDLAGLPATDLAHLSGDLKRVYGLLVGQWLAYMGHLRTSYPYLFSLAMRTNPFDKSASVVIE